MNDPLDYLSGLELRLRADGCEVATTSLPLGPALVGRRSDFRIRWALTRLHLFTIAAKQEAASRVSCLARPVVIHAPTGQSYLFRADAALGLVYNHHLRSRAAAYFPEP